MKLFSSTIPYLLLISSFSSPMNDLGIEKIQAINESPYHGVAVPVIDAYDPEKYTGEDFETALEYFKQESQKDIWPWVFFNRFVGFEKNGRSHGNLGSEQEYFKAIKGMDLYNYSGALQDFTDMWRMALVMARELGSPGIVIDAEAYNNYEAYQVTFVASQLGKSGKQVRERLQEIGGELVDIADEVYPQATLWFLFTGLTDQIVISSFLRKCDYRTVTYIVLGMLERAKAKQSDLKFVSGDCPSLGYCYESLVDLENRIRQSNKKLAPLLKTYSGLYRAGRISPWDKKESKQGWMVKWPECKDSEIENIQDFIPLIRQLMKSYKYIWIHAAWAASYDPYKKESATPHNRILEQILSEYQ